MIYGVFAVRDHATCFMSPIVDMSERSAQRNFARALSQENSLMEFKPDDFDLYQIGTFDDQTGALKPLDPVVIVARGDSLRGANDVV